MITPGVAGVTLHACRARGLVTEADGRTARGPLAPRRGELCVGREGLVLGDWHIPYERIDDAVLASYRQLLVPGLMLSVDVGGRVYRFGFRPHAFWEGELPFPVRRVRGRVRRGVLGWSVTLALSLLAVALVVLALKSWS